MAEAYTDIPLSPIRKAIASRMVEAVRSIPHFRMTVELMMDPLLQQLDVLRANRPPIVPSVNDLLIKACGLALIETPAVNTQWVDGLVRQCYRADISIVMSTGAGLAAPIVRRAESKSIAEISREVRQLRERAMKNALKMDEVSDGSFSISNLGMYGVDQFDAIINPPQCAILAVGAAKRSVVVTPHDEVRVARVLKATVSADHRAMDGATVAAFLNVLKRLVEQPASWCTEARK